MKIRSPQSIYRPHWLYEASPILYVAAGLWAWLKLQSGAAYVFGTLLILAGCHVLLMRKEYRNRKADTKANEDDALMTLVWDHSRECKHETIDAEHRDLFIALHAMFDAAKDRGTSSFNLTVDDFIKKLAAHFRSEEAILHQGDPSIANAHALAHRAILSGVSDAYGHYRQGKIKRAELIGHITSTALLKHLHSDQRTFKQAF